MRIQYLSGLLYSTVLCLFIPSLIHSASTSLYYNYCSGGWWNWILGVQYITFPCNIVYWVMQHTWNLINNWYALVTVFAFSVMTNITKNTYEQYRN